MVKFFLSCFGFLSWLFVFRTLHFALIEIFDAMIIASSCRMCKSGRIPPEELYVCINHTHYNFLFALVPYWPISLPLGLVLYLGYQAYRGLKFVFLRDIPSSVGKELYRVFWKTGNEEKVNNE